MPLQLQFTDSSWEHISQDWNAWWAGELKRALVILECIEPKDESTPHYASTFLGNYGLSASPDELLDLFVPRLQATHYLGDAFPRFWPNFGPGITAVCAGAHLHATPDTTWFSPDSASDISDLHIDYRQRHAWWRKVTCITQGSVDRWGVQLSIGLTDLGGNLDILAHLRGTEQLLLDMVDAPGEVDRLVGEAHRLWWSCYEELYALTRHGRGITCWGPCWSDGRGYLLQSDISYMISPHMFERFVLPDIEAGCNLVNYAFYHLDGKGQIPHLDMLLATPRLRGIQWVPGDGQPQAEQWIPLIRRIQQSGKLCQVYVSAMGALTILRQLGGKGLCLAINESLTPEQGQGLLSEIRQLR
jgi:5-methyltetrahydrofolate--homocysteine methyltransferase